MMKKLVLLGLVLVASLSTSLKAQYMAVRTNLAALAVGNLNIEGSMRVMPNLSIHLPLQAKPFDYPLPMPIGLLGNIENEYGGQYIQEFGFVRHSKNITIQPGVRYWFNDVYNRGLFVGAHGVASWFQWGGDHIQANYKEGLSYGVGLSMGYSYELSKRWNIEGEIGIGHLWRQYEYKHTDTGKSLSPTRHDSIFSLTRIGVSLVYIIN